MNDLVTGAVAVTAVVACLTVLVQLIRDEPVGDRIFVLLGLAELVLVVQVVTGLVTLGHTDRDVDGVLFGSYLVSLILVLPIGAFWSLAERSRAGTAVLLLAGVTVLVLELRLHDIWTANA